MVSDRVELERLDPKISDRTGGQVKYVHFDPPGVHFDPQTDKALDAHSDERVLGGTIGGARFGALRLGEGRMPSRDCVGRGKVPVAGERGVGPRSFNVS